MKYLLYLLAFLSVGLTDAQSYEYPESPKLPVENTYHGVTVVDDYRWLEKLYDKRSWGWKEDQIKYTNKTLKKFDKSDRGEFRNTVSSLMKYKFEDVNRQGKYFVYHTSNSISISTSPLAPGKLMALVEAPRQIINYAISKDSRFLAYQTTEKGSDWSEIKVVGIGKLGASGISDPKISYVRQSGIHWRGRGFFYTRYPKENTLGKLSGMEVYYHAVGTKQADDVEVFSRPKKSNQHFRIKVTSDERFLIINEVDLLSNGFQIYYIDFESEAKKLQRLDLDRYIDIVDHKNGKFIGIDEQKYEKGAVVAIDPKDSSVEVLVKERDEFFSSIVPLKDKFLVKYHYDIKEKVVCYNYKGTELDVIKVPEGWSVHGFTRSYLDNEIYFYYTSYTIPPVMYVYNTDTYETKLYKQTTVKHNVKDYEWDLIDYQSKDSTLVSLMIVYKKGMDKNGKNPTVLKAYGGFGISTFPSFSPEVVAFLNKGGVYAFAHIRGGGYKGSQWAADGNGMNKQNGVDDFISAAEYLIRENYTSSKNLGITGASHGGLIVGAAITQRPELFRVAVPVVGVFDLLRHEKYTVGHLHGSIFGTVKNKKSFETMYEYSPYHNIDPSVNYPATLVMTSEFDDRVVPSHSYKFVAKLQNSPGQLNPILLRVEKDAGHSGPITSAAYLDAQRDMHLFILHWTRNER